MFPNVHSTKDVIDNSPEIAVFVVLLTTLLLATVFLYRWGWLDDSSQDGNQQLPMAAMEKVHNPFILSLVDSTTNSIEYGATFSLKSQVPCHVRFYWGMLIEDIYPLMYQTWVHLRHTMEENLMKEFALQSEEFIFVEAVDKQLPVKPRDATLSTGLGAPPRNRYPLVVVVSDMEAFEQEIGQDVLDHKVVLSVGMFHIKDPVCPGDSHAIAQYVRTPNGRPCNLMQMYVSTDNEPEQDQSHDQHSSQSENGSLCVICVSEPVSRVFLPCRHACVCDTCCGRVTHCPMCRTIIGRSFVLETSDE